MIPQLVRLDIITKLTQKLSNQKSKLTIVKIILDELQRNYSHKTVRAWQVRPGMTRETWNFARMLDDSVKMRTNCGRRQQKKLS